MNYFNYSSVAFVSSTDAYGQAGSSTFLRAAEGAKLTVSANVRFDPGSAVAVGDISLRFRSRALRRILNLPTCTAQYSGTPNP